MTQSLASAAAHAATREILDLLAINDERLLGDESAFWHEVAVACGLEPRASIVENAKAVLESLSEWDADYLQEDGARLSGDAYREVLAAINDRTNNGSVPWPDVDRQPELLPDEDDEDPSSWTAFQLGVGTHRQPDVRTMLTMVYEDELSLNPTWQRNFVWSLKKQRRFIESVLMGLPIPSLLLFEDSRSGQSFVIDGRQRLETLARFCATPEQRERVPFLGKAFKTFPASEPGWREGEELHEAASKRYSQLPDVHKRKVDRAILTVFTFRSLERRQLYQIFQRYNTGGEKLRAAEIRNAVYQATELHKMLWRMAGESPDTVPFVDGDEEYAAQTLRNIMQNKTARYGAYDFLGRVMAFTYLSNGKAVAPATNDFMDTFEGHDKELLRTAYLRAFDKVVSWYRYPLSVPTQDGKFHGFLATIQLATAHHALSDIDSDRLTEQQVQSAISSGWLSFAQETLEMKQNAANFWQRQGDWLNHLRTSANGEVERR